MNSEYPQVRRGGIRWRCTRPIIAVVIVEVRTCRYANQLARHLATKTIPNNPLTQVSPVLLMIIIRPVTEARKFSQIDNFGSFQRSRRSREEQRSGTEGLVS